MTWDQRFSAGRSTPEGHPETSTEPQTHFKEGLRSILAQTSLAPTLRGRAGVPERAV